MYNIGFTNSVRRHFASSEISLTILLQPCPPEIFAKAADNLMMIRNQGISEVVSSYVYHNEH